MNSAKLTKPRIPLRICWRTIVVRKMFCLVVRANGSREIDAKAKRKNRTTNDGSVLPRFFVMRSFRQLTHIESMMNMMPMILLCISLFAPIGK